MSGEFISVPNEGSTPRICIFIIFPSTSSFIQISDSLTTNLDDYEVGKSLQVTSILSESKHWIVVQLPVAYIATNWPIRVSINNLLFTRLYPYLPSSTALSLAR